MENVRNWIGISDFVLGDEQRRELHMFLLCGGGARPWVFGWKSNKDTTAFPFWHRHFAGYTKADGEKDAYDCEAELEPFPIVHGLWRHLSLTLLAGHRLVRCYANGASYGSDGNLHYDTTLPDSYTTVYYPHEKWAPDWGGETVFFNMARDDIIGCVYPKPNRLVTFDGRVPHVARGVSRICPVLRVTLMFKTDCNGSRADLHHAR